MNTYEALTLAFSAISALGVGYEAVHRFRARAKPRVRLVIDDSSPFVDAVLVVENDSPRPVRVTSLIVRAGSPVHEFDLAGNEDVPPFGRVRFQTRGKILYSRLKCIDSRGRVAITGGEHHD